MHLKDEVLKQIDTPKIRRKIADALGVGEMAIVKAISVNPPHSSLTKIAALECISNELGIEIKNILK